MLESQQQNAAREDRLPKGRLFVAHASGDERRGRHAYAAAIALALVLDAIAILFAAALATSLLVGHAPVPSSKAVALVFGAWMVLLGIRGMYALEYLSPATTTLRILNTSIIALTVMAATSYFGDEWLPKEWLLYEVVIAAVALSLLRAFLGALLCQKRRHGKLYRRALVVGEEGETEQLASRLNESSACFDVVGRFALRRRDGGRDGSVGMGDELKHVIETNGADCVYVASHIDHADHMREISRAVRQADAEMRVVSSLPEMHPRRLRFETVRGGTLIVVRPILNRLLQRRAKRALDVICSAVLLLVSLPLWGFIALALRDKILFAQTRVGEGGRLFRMYKFRTMIVDAEDARSDVVALNEAEGPLFKIREDPRVTTFGRLLRRWSLDELPQLWNVLRGDMSLVGPRPPLPEEVRRYECGWHKYRLDVPPGITGLWQVSGRSDLSFEEYVRLDLKYVENWSLGLDLVILLKTIPAVLSRRGAS